MAIPNTPAPEPDAGAFLEGILKATQENSAAIKSLVDVTRTRRAEGELSPEAMSGEIKNLQARIAQFETEQKAKEELLHKLGGSKRAAEFSVADVTEIIRESQGLGKSDAKHVFDKLGRMHAAKSPLYKMRFGEKAPEPFELLIRGALIAPESKNVRAAQDSPNGFGGMTVLSAGDSEELCEARKLNDAAVFWAMCQRADGRMSVNFQQFPLYKELQEAIGLVRKTLGDSSGSSAYDPTGFSSDLIERYELSRVVLRYLNVFQVPRSPFLYPVVGARPTTYKQAEASADPESATVVPVSDMTPVNVQFTLASLAARSSWTYEADIDWIVMASQIIMAEMGRSLAYTEEQVLLDGDTQATHMDNDVTTSSSARKLYKGLRRHAIQNAYTTDISSFTTTSFRGMIQSMGVYGANPADLVWIVSPSVRAQLLTLLDANNNPVMLGLWGQGITQVQTLGNVGQLFGSPVVVVESFRQDLAATGMYDGTTKTKTGVLLVNKRAWGYAYDSEAPLTDSQKWIRTRQMEVVTSVRRDFEPLYAIASNKCVWYGINVTS